MASTGWSVMGAGYPECPQESGFHRLQKRNNHYGAATTLYWSALMSAWYVDQDCNYRVGGPVHVGNSYNYIASLPRPKPAPGHDLEQRLAALEKGLKQLQNAYTQSGIALGLEQPQSALSDKQYEAAWLAGAKAFRDEYISSIKQPSYTLGAVLAAAYSIDIVNIKAKYDAK